MKNNKTVFISAYRNVSIRYILYSDIFSELKKNNFMIYIFVKDNDVEHYKNIFNDINVKVLSVKFYEAMELNKKYLNTIFTLSRRIFSGSKSNYKNTTDHYRKKQIIAENSSGLLSGVRLFLVKILSFLGSKSKFVRTLFLKIEELILNGNIYNNYFEKYEPDLLIISSLGNQIDAQFMRCAKRKKCKVVTIIHNWDNPTTKGYKGASPNLVICWNEIMKKEVSIFQDIINSNIVVGGIAHWDIYFRKEIIKNRNFFKDNYNLDSNKKTIFYGSSSPFIFQKTLNSIESILDLISKKKIEHKTQLFVRLHPSYLNIKDNNQLLDNYRNKIDHIKNKYKNLVFFNTPKVKKINDDVDLPISDIKTLGNILINSALVINEYSSLMIEAAIFNKPIINIGLHSYRDTNDPISVLEDFTHIKRIIKTGATKQCHNLDNLMNCINDYLAKPELDENHRKKLINQEIISNNSNSGQYIGNIIKNYLNDIGHS